MEQVDRKTFAEALLATGELYDRKISNTVAAIYFDDLREHPIEAVLHAFSAHRRDPDRGRFFPKVADLIDKLDGSIVDRAALAWSSVLRLSSNSAEAEADDPVAEQTVADMGGWTRLGRSDERSLGFMAREFERIYTANAKRVASGQSLLSRTGLRLIGKD